MAEGSDTLVGTQIADKDSVLSRGANAFTSTGPTDTLDAIGALIATRCSRG